MAIQLRFESEIARLEGKISELRRSAIKRATRAALNRGLKSLVTESDRAIRKEYKLSSRAAKSRMRISKRFTGTVESMHGSVAYSGKPIGLIEFVKGSKQPRPQFGRPIRSRRKLAVEIKRGKAKKLRHAFIAKGKGNKNQVFVRKTSDSNPLARQSVPSFAFRFKNQIFRRPIQKNAAKTLNTQFRAALRAELMRARKT